MFKYTRTEDRKAAVSRRETMMGTEGAWVRVEIGKTFNFSYI